MGSHFDRSFTRITGTISRVKELFCNGSWHEALVHFNEAKRAGVEITQPSVINSVVKASSKLSNKHGKSIHGWVLKQGLDTFSSVGNSILDSYMKCRDLDSAMGIFRSMRSRDSVSWNVIIHWFLDQRDLGRGLWWFRRARVDGFEPTVATLVLLLQVCRSTWLMNQLFELHGYITKSGFWGSVPVQNSLLGAYTGFDMERAEDMFDEMLERDVISWSVMIAGYVHNEEADLGLRMFVKMVSVAKIDPDEVTLVSVLKACTSIQSMIVGRMAHGFVLGKGLDADSFVENSLIDMYCKCGDVDSAFRVFSHMTWANLVSWNSIVSGCVLNEKYSEALSVFRSMGKDEIEADEVTLVNVLQTCKYYVNLSWCKSVHCLVFRKGYESNDFLHNSLIDAYIKCGRIEIAWDLFNSMDKKDTVSWSTMISGLTYNGEPDEAVRVFNEMIHAQKKPNAITIINLLEACSVSAELKRSKSAHGIAIRTCLAPEVAVGTAIVDMYSKCGTIELARKSFDQISDKNVLSWSAMVAGYGMNGLAREALTLLAEMKLHNIKPNEVTALSVLSACSHGGFVKEGLSFFESMVDEYDLHQGVEHYSCVVDMLSRAGKFDKAIDLIKEMPEVLASKASVWGALLSASKSFANKDMGKDVVPRILELEPSNSANYMLASSMYAACGLWSDAARMRRLAKERGIGVMAGYSTVNVNNRSCRFIAGDESHPQACAIQSTVKQLHRCMRINGISDLMSIGC
ncbi:pentatricopeptide repeat-containing protein At2g17210 [Rhodamnia argentea]|uniref:Pentatricopeptide repeat-containing protein At2g17210 n=1 Tax=Rhodamnia argentea TaxID=178133 RepID=A0A8B8NJZ6_9MYRT|nr:pentatricopeptide repeat-containing protein At2g17210 [Rhodamnia argentea]